MILLHAAYCSRENQLGRIYHITSSQQRCCVDDWKVRWAVGGSGPTLPADAALLTPLCRAAAVSGVEPRVKQEAKPGTNIQSWQPGVAPLYCWQKLTVKQDTNH